MKYNIAPVPAFPKYGVALEACLVADNLVDSAVFEWRIVNEDDAEVAKGRLAIDRDDYAAWGGDNYTALAMILSKVGAESPATEHPSEE